HWCTEVETLCGTQALDGEHRHGAVDDLEEMERRRRTHADVVLLVCGGWDGVDRGWMRERLQLVDEGRSRVLHDHQSALHTRMLGQKRRQTRMVPVGQPRGPAFGDRGQLGHGSFCVVERE